MRLNGTVLLTVKLRAAQKRTPSNRPPFTNPRNDCQAAPGRGARINVRTLSPANTAAFTA